MSGRDMLSRLYVSAVHVAVHVPVRRPLPGDTLQDGDR